MNNPNHQERSEVSDTVLIELLSTDCDWALKEIFDRYNIKLFRLAEGVLNNEDLAKDVVQEIFIDLWNRRHSSNIQVLGHYLVRAVKFQVLKQLRQGKARAHHLELMHNILVINQTEESIHYKELEGSLKKALNNLSPRCKEVFEMSRFENLSHKEIAEKLGITPKTVEVQIHKALTYLRTCINSTLMLILCMFF